MGRSHPGDTGFTLIELTVVVALLAVLVLLAIPVYVSARGNAEKKTCFANQTTLQRAAEVYLSVNLTATRADLKGLVNDAHPVRVENIVGSTPICQSGDAPADRGNPTIAEGAYSFDADGQIVPCTLGDIGPHGSPTGP